MIIFKWLLFLYLPLMATQNCPPALSDADFASKCTSQSVKLVQNGSKIEYKDCSIHERPVHPINKSIKHWVEKIRCIYKARVVVTSGYRSNKHNLYSWAYVVKKTGETKTVSKKSKHRLGRAVDFYVKGLSFNEHKKLVPKLHLWAGQFEQKVRGSRQKIWIKVYRSSEGRDPDNQHEFPYIHIELR